MNRSTFNQLNKSQQVWYAKIMIDLILADGQVHHNEQRYLDEIFELFATRQDVLDDLRGQAVRNGPEGIGEVKGIPKKLAKDILKDCVSVAISDADFHEEEKRLIQEIGHNIGCTDSEVSQTVTWGNELMGHIFAFTS